MGGSRFLDVLALLRRQERLDRSRKDERRYPALTERPAVDGGGCLLRDEDGATVRRLCCPACFAPALDNEGLPLEREQLESKKQDCRECGGPLWQADRSGPRRFPLSTE